MGGGRSEPAPTPAPTPAPPPPDRTQSQVQNSASEQRQKYYGSSGGRTNTYLSRSGGNDASSTAVRLLGNVGR